MKGKSNERARSVRGLNSNAPRRNLGDKVLHFEKHTPPPEKETPETPPLNRICTPSNARQTTYDWE